MTILKKIMTAVRGGVREAGESIIDANGVRILEQEIKDAQEHLGKAKRDLTEVMAKEMQAKRKVKSIREEITEHEGFAGQALDKGNEELALEIAEKIARLEQDHAEQQEVANSFGLHAQKLKDLTRKTERQIKEYERQLTMVKTTESVQKASAAITDNFASSSSKIISAKESLDRITQRQQDQFGRMAAAEELEGEFGDKDLNDKLKEAGIMDSDDGKANAVLERLKAGRS